MKRRSLRFRLTAWCTLILALAFSLAGLGVWWILRQSILETVDKDLRSRLEAFRAYLGEERALPDAASLSEELAEQAATAPRGTRFRITGANGRALYSSPGAGSWPSALPPPTALSPKGRAETILDSGMPYRLLAAPVSLGVVQIGVPLDEFFEMLDRFTWTAAFAFPLLLLLATLGAYWMSGRALAPLERVTRAAQQIQASNLSERLPVDGPGDELDRLSSTLNLMFGRLQAAFDRLVQFTADASHELRTPVAIMRTTAEVTLTRTRATPEYIAALERILQESEHTTALIEDLMTLARADAGAGDVALQPVDLAACLRQTCAEVRVLAEAAQLRLETELPTHCSIQADEPLLRRLFLVLLDNAIKYTPPNGLVQVSLRTRGASACVTIADTGAGIPAEHLPHIFERFYRAAQHRSRADGGAGLGLSIAQWIAARHGSKITVESAPHAGSTFQVCFPAFSVSSEKAVTMKA